MFFSRRLFFFFFLGILILPFFLSMLSSVAEVVDCIVARIDSEIITLTDVRISQAFGLGSGSDFPATTAGLRRCLEGAIDRKVVIHLAPVKVTVSDAEVDDLRKRIKARFSPTDWERKLEAFGLNEEDLNPYLREILLADKIITLRFSQSAEVTLKEIEAYYENIYRPEEEARGRKPMAMIQVLGEIESRIRKEKTEKQVSLWIENLRRQSEVWINVSCLEGRLNGEEKT